MEIFTIKSVHLFRLKLFLLLSLFFSTQVFGIEVDISVSIHNGTRKVTGFAETLRLIDLNSQMKILSEITNVQGKFTFSKISISESSSLLLQAKYMGVNYNKVVSLDPNSFNKPQEITVFDSEKNFHSTEIRGLLQIVRTKNEIIINKIYIFSNTSNPPVSFLDPDKQLEIYVPKSATEVFGQISQNESKMGIPLTLAQGKNGRILDRAILPGVNELQLTYSISAPDLSDIEFEDKLLFDQSKNGQIVFLKPEDIQLRIIGAKEFSLLENGVPKKMKAYKVTYSKINEEVKFQVSGGTPFVPEENRQDRIISNGTIFINWQKSILGIVLALSILAFLHFLFSAFEKKTS
ncbi:MAG: hypothetical protein L6Q54_09765 [Leptospiraceae bacterium]|nr:hypothetical protein [Leptospiraceae bacterium]MCK6381512.1 hypothetical protein [Leptospiraceae bacterium]NUM41130.1 hypothetical protein [Leptospiraceae bacterium]